ncbi:MAG: hypothetical protein U9Q18_05310 [Caldisericota bacterium]|nr:hypothetical protein [Caldisericota bacterium]
MKKVSIKFILLVVLCLLLIGCSFSRIAIYSKDDGKPIAFASATRGKSNYYTNYQGNLSFFRTAFPEKVKLFRLGYNEKTVQLPFAIFYSSARIFLDTASYEEIQGQIFDIFDGVSSYEYEYYLTVSGENSKSQEFVAKCDGKNFFFESNGDFSGSDMKIWSIDSQMYKSDDNLLVEGPLTAEEKQALYERNIVFIPIQELLTLIFPADLPNEIKVENNVIYFAWENGNMEIKISENRFPVEVNFESKESATNVAYKLMLNIMNINGEVNITNEL